MAGLVKTYTGDLTQSIAKRIYEAALVGDAYRQDAKDIIDPQKAGVDDFKLNRGEFFGHALRSKATGWLPRRFQHQMPDLKGSEYLMRGQKRSLMSPFASPINPQVKSSSAIVSTPGSALKAPLPSMSAGQLARLDPIEKAKMIQERMGLPIIQAESGFIPDGKKNIFNKARSLFGQGVKVREEKLGKFLSAVAESLSASLGSINRKMDEANEGIIIAKDGISATHKQLEGSSSILESKLDDIIDALRAQNHEQFRANDKQESAVKEMRDDQKEDLSNTLEIQKKDYDQQEIAAMEARDRAEDDRGDISDPWQEPDVKQLALPFNPGPGGDGFRMGGLARGPDSGYLAVLHGDEYIVPDDNNFTQGQPSAVGKYSIGNMPFMAERGLVPGSHPGDNPKSMTPTFSPSSNITNNINSNNISGDTSIHEDLGQAIQLPAKAAGLMTVGIINKVLQKSTFGPEVGTRINQIIEPIAAAFGVSSASLSGLEQGMEARSKSDAARRETLTRDQSRDTDEKNVFQKFTSWISGKGGHGASAGRSGSTSNTSYNRSSSVNINKPSAKGGGGVFESIRNWFGLAKDPKGHEVSGDTFTGKTINSMRNYRLQQQQMMDMMDMSSNPSSSSEYFTKHVVFGDSGSAKKNILESPHGLTTIAQRVNDQSIDEELSSLLNSSTPDMNVINNATRASKKPDIVHSALAVRGNPWEDGTYTGAYEGFG